MIYIYSFYLILAVVLFFYFRHVFFIPTYQGPVTDHFDGKRFHDPDGNKMGSFTKMMQHQFKVKKGHWDAHVENGRQEIMPEFADNDILLKHINHATCLLIHDKLTIITDPVFSQRASPYEFIGPQRHRDPSISIEDLPKIDVIMISHDHYDHLDLKSVLKIQEKHHCKVLCGLGLKNYLEKFKIEAITEMDWQESITINSLKITFLPAKHWSNRMAAPYKTLWGSYMIESGSRKIYFAGDSAYGNHFKSIADQFGAIDLALIPIGAYEPRFFMKYVHMNPEDAVQAYKDLNADQNFAIHWGTFSLTHESMYDPIEQLQLLMDHERRENFHYDQEHRKWYLF